MLDILRSALAIVFVFGVVVFVHELGHFLAAKLMGVYAPRFSIGFGPALWSRKWGETEYILASLPLGGYVRMASREDEAMAMLEGGNEKPVAHVETVGAGDIKIADEDRITPNAPATKYWDPNGMAPFGPNPVPEHRLFESKSLPARLLIMVAGVTMNVILGYVILTGVLLAYGDEVTATRTVGRVETTGSTAALRGRLQVGDSITAVDGSAVRSWNDVRDAIAFHEGSPVRIGTQRGEQAIDVGAAGQPTREEVALALTPMIAPVIDSVVAGKAAARAGLRRGDSVVSVGGKPVRSWFEMVDTVEVSAGVPLQFVVQRAGAPTTLLIQPQAESVRDPLTGHKRQIGRIGAAPRPLATTRVSVPLGRALSLGLQQTKNVATGIVDILHKLVTRRVSPDVLGGPVQIATQSAQAAKAGFDYLLTLLAIISINLAIFNLLPIPILDGGQILLNIAEAVRGRAFSDRTRQWIAYAGLAAIALLVTFALFNDTRRLLP